MDTRERGRSSPGSSPLTRGKPRSMTSATIASGLIPAHAGKTRDTAFLTGATTAHPRSRGENCTYAINASTDAGSSPLTRGKHRQRGRLLDRNRLIPAHAGKTSKLEGTDVNFEAHPRSRGENGLTSAGTAVKAGSSPLTRGKHAIPAASATPMRLIPAHAGKTSRGPSKVRASTAHPRSRGENKNVRKALNVLAGSSPLTRGKPSGGASSS